MGADPRYLVTLEIESIEGVSEDDDIAPGVVQFGIHSLVFAFRGEDVKPGMRFRFELTGEKTDGSRRYSQLDAIKKGE